MGAADSFVIALAEIGKGFEGSFVLRELIDYRSDQDGGIEEDFHLEGDSEIEVERFSLSF
jgi:hypothetical protein